MSLNDMVKSLLVCNNLVIRQSLIEDILAKIKNDIDLCTNEDVLFNYQDVLYLLQSRFQINIVDLIKKANIKLKSTFSERHIKNMETLNKCINSLPIWLDKSFLMKECCQMTESLNLNPNDKTSLNNEDNEDKTYDNITKSIDVKSENGNDSNNTNNKKDSESEQEQEPEKEFLKQFNIPVIIKPCVYDRSLVEEVTESMYEKLSSHLEYLKNLPQPEQRSEEWYQYRNNMLTASDLHRGLTSRDKTRLQLINSKCGVSRSISSNASCLHGIRYEDVAIAVYEKRNNCKVEDYGCIQHPTIKIFGASPDGIVSSSNKQLVGRMLEIKCPYSRVIDGLPKKEYFAQIQGQLEVCDLEYCDFLECDIKEYNSHQDLMEDHQDTDELEWGVIIQIYDIKEAKNKDIICEYIDASKEELEDWIDQRIDIILEDDNLEYIKAVWWKLRLYSCVLVKRDRELFQSFIPGINKFWEDVEYYREKGILDTNPKSEKKYKPEEEINFV